MSPPSPQSRNPRGRFSLIVTLVCPLVSFLLGLGVFSVSKKREPISIKTYCCPMAPKPGLGMQAKGPLRNLLFGAQMLECGKEVLD